MQGGDILLLFQVSADLLDAVLLTVQQQHLTRGRLCRDIIQKLLVICHRGIDHDQLIGNLFGRARLLLIDFRDQRLLMQDTLRHQARIDGDRGELGTEQQTRLKLFQLEIQNVLLRHTESSPILLAVPYITLCITINNFYNVFPSKNIFYN